MISLLAATHEHFVADPQPVWVTIVVVYVALACSHMGDEVLKKPYTQKHPGRAVLRVLFTFVFIFIFIVIFTTAFDSLDIYGKMLGR